MTRATLGQAATQELNECLVRHAKPNPEKDRRKTKPAPAPTSANVPTPPQKFMSDDDDEEDEDADGADAAAVSDNEKEQGSQGSDSDLFENRFARADTKNSRDTNQVGQDKLFRDVDKALLEKLPSDLSRPALSPALL